MFLFGESDKGLLESITTFFQGFQSSKDKTPPPLSDGLKEAAANLSRAEAKACLWSSAVEGANAKLSHVEASLYEAGMKAEALRRAADEADRAVASLQRQQAEAQEDLYRVQTERARALCEVAADRMAASVVALERIRRRKGSQADYEAVADALALRLQTLYRRRQLLRRVPPKGTARRRSIDAAASFTLSSLPEDAEDSVAAALPSTEEPSWMTHPPRSLMSVRRCPAALLPHHRPFTGLASGSLQLPAPGGPGERAWARARALRGSSHLDRADGAVPTDCTPAQVAAHEEKGGQRLVAPRRIRRRLARRLAGFCGGGGGEGGEVVCGGDGVPGPWPWPPSAVVAGGDGVACVAGPESKGARLE